MDDFGFQVAFKVETINKDESRSIVHDPDMVDYAIVFDQTDKDGTNTPTEVGHHKCNISDYEKFSPPKKGQKSLSE